MSSRPDVFQAGAYIHNSRGALFEIVERDADRVWLENCLTGWQHDELASGLCGDECWQLVRPAPAEPVVSD